MKAEGLSNRQIGKILGLDEKTIRNDADNSAVTSSERKKLRGKQSPDAESSAPLDTTAAIRADAELRKTAELAQRPDAGHGRGRARVSLGRDS